MKPLPAPPLDGFDLHPIPTIRLPGMAAVLDKMARHQRKSWPLLSQKLSQQSETLLVERRKRVGCSDVSAARHGAWRA